MYTPMVSTVGLNGQLEDPPVAGVQSGSWISSFAPAAAIAGFVGLTATVDSFCLFCGKWVAAGLTRCSVAVAADATDAAINAAVVVAAAARVLAFASYLPPYASCPSPNGASVDRAIEMITKILRSGNFGFRVSHSSGRCPLGVRRRSRRGRGDGRGSFDDRPSCGGDGVPSGAERGDTFACRLTRPLVEHVGVQRVPVVGHLPASVASLRRAEE
jgi:hypothetical protein